INEEQTDLNRLMRQAEWGDPVAQFEVGELYYCGCKYDISKNYKQAAAWYRKSAEQGYAEAQNDIGFLYEKGLGVEKDYFQASGWYRKAAQKGYVVAQNNIGFLYEKGLGVEKDYLKAAYWYRKAAHQGNNWAQQSLGYLYEKGLGVEQDYAQATLWYRKTAEQMFGNLSNQFGCSEILNISEKTRQSFLDEFDFYLNSTIKAAEQGDTLAQNVLGFYFILQKEPYNFIQAYKWIRKAAEKNDAFAQMFLATFYHCGVGVSIDYSQAAFWYRKAAENEIVDAQTALAHFYENGIGVKQSYSDAVHWYYKAADNDEPMAQKQLGYMWENGKGVNKDYVMASFWYGEAIKKKNPKDDSYDIYLKNAAEQGSPYGQTIVGKLYHDDEDYINAAFWFKKAAEQEVEIAEFILGTLYENGQGVEQNYKKAAYWYRKAANQGNVWAQNSLSHLYENGLGVDQDYKEALVLYRKAAAKGDATAQANLAEAIEYGKGDRIDYKEAQEWYQKAALQGIQHAQNALERLKKGNWGTLQLQHLLAKKGFDSGVMDGVLKPEIYDALKKYRDENGLLEDHRFLTAMHNYLFENNKDEHSERGPKTSLVPQIKIEERFEPTKYYALLIGVSNYPNLPPHRNLETPINDVKDVASLLSNKYGFEVTILENPDRTAIIDKLDEFTRTSFNEQNYNLLIYYAGHGFYDTDLSEGYWWPRNASDKSKSEWLSNGTLTNFIHGMKAQHVLVIADTCFSGSILRGPSITKRDSTISNKTYLKSMYNGRSRYALTSGTMQPVSDNGGANGNSVFASVFIKQLKENQEIIEMGRLSLKIIEVVEGKTFKTTKQKPRYGIIPPPLPIEEQGDFVFIPEGLDPNG
ncbi:MAG: caspase family protein, partial [Desulfobacterales bacterium]|nr:caspase family protein [Desulfobacterales bacterium]